MLEGEIDPSGFLCCEGKALAIQFGGNLGRRQKGIDEAPELRQPVVEEAEAELLQAATETERVQFAHLLGELADVLPDQLEQSLSFARVHAHRRASKQHDTLIEVQLVEQVTQPGHARLEFWIVLGVACLRINQAGRDQKMGLVENDQAGVMLHQSIDHGNRLVTLLQLLGVGNEVVMFAGGKLARYAIVRIVNNG